MPLTLVYPGLVRRTLHLVGRGIHKWMEWMHVLLSLEPLNPPGPGTKLKVCVLHSRRSDLAQRTSVGSHLYFSPLEWSYKTYSTSLSMAPWNMCSLGSAPLCMHS